MNSTDQQLYMFHFLCPLCGSEPEPVPLRQYLSRWAACDAKRLQQLISMFSGSITEIRNGDSRWLTKKFQKAADSLLNQIKKLSYEGTSRLQKSSHNKLFLDCQCPVCFEDRGIRKTDGYFVDWNNACKVQTGNLLYEVGLVIWSVLLALPSWADGKVLTELNETRLKIWKTGKSLSLMECPQCGRFTNTLYGDPTPEETGFCRWCLDSAGGGALSIELSFDEEGEFEISTLDKADCTIPARNLWDILPPEVTKKMKA